MLQKAEAIVIRTTNYGESHSILTLYTREFGKVGVMARGAKKPKSRLASISQLFIYGSYLFHKSPGLSTLNQGEIIHSFRTIREDLTRASYASYVVELIDRLTDERQRNPYLFELLWQTLQYMDEGVDPEILTRVFEVKMLIVAGIRPQLDCCASCGQTEGDFAFSIKEAGFICHRCFHKDPYVMKISTHTVKLLRLFYHFDLNRLGKVSVKQATKQELKEVISAYYDEYSGLSLKSKRFLDQLERMNLLTNSDS
ncbi:DNA repair protein RecO [Desertibacillus haloalkaliphilus]|uniref:DNA repair protein RecO n=1 Tax=Desertibacillus haloalkaliphilus TaxID=1328930 RepID=UPI001C260F98|nr:DNA repair protein RecO [Desertibacillus haloalkaliphilus]MBU8905673.1 DNA repair protein RecO [Desertibacillus haloalkaliphilus]